MSLETLLRRINIFKTRESYEAQKASLQETDFNLVPIDLFAFDAAHPVGSIYHTSSAENPAITFGLGTWELSRKLVNTIGWCDFTYFNNTYYGTTQSSYTSNQWCVVNNILSITCGAGATAKIDTGDEIHLFSIPIKNALVIPANGNSYSQVWTGAVGGGGIPGGFYLRQNDDDLSIHLKPHTSTNFVTAPWYSSFFTIPFREETVITDTSLFVTDYFWKRTA